MRKQVYRYICSCGAIFIIDHEKSNRDRITIKCSKNCGATKEFYPLGCPGKDYVSSCRGGFRQLGVYDG